MFKTRFVLCVDTGRPCVEAANDLMTEEILQGDIDNGQEAKLKRCHSEGVEQQDIQGRRPPKGDVAGGREETAKSCSRSL